MKKFKKLLAGILAGAMMLGSMTTTAFADEGSGSTTPPVSTIDTNANTSLTIHKYTKGTTPSSNASGKEDRNQVPTDTTAIKDVGFTVYRVKTQDELLNYYNGKNEDLLANNYYTKDATGKITVNSSLHAICEEKKTDTNGIVTFKKDDGLTLGIYLVVETSSPAIVTGPCDPFLVSVPMTVDNNKWLYDVHVYPKNSTAVGAVKLIKTGVDSANLKGVTFVLQKKDGTDNDGKEKWIGIVKKSTEQGDNTGNDLILTTNEKGEIEVEGLSSGDYRFIETSVWDDQNNGNGQGYIMDGATVYPFTVKGNNVTYKNQKGEMETGTNIAITVNNEKPDMIKQVQKRDNTWGQDADYNVGDMVPYKITIDVPSNITRLKEFTLTDTPTNLKDSIQTNAGTSESFIVKCDDVSITNETEKVIYAVTRFGENGFEIKFSPSNMSDYAGKKIVIEYNAKLLDGAATTTDGNPNTAKLEYSNKILPETGDESNPNKPGKDSIEDNAIVYTFSVKIDKRANSATGDPLSGVKFDLYKYAGTESNPTEAELKENGTLIAKDLTTGTDGTITKSGLANGIYYLVETKTAETKTAEKYNLLKAPVQVSLNIQYTTSMSESLSWVNNNDGTSTLVKHKIDNSKTTFRGNDTSTPTYGTHTETIINKKGFTLPTTGGMGTVIFSVLGIALVLAGLLVISASRKKAAK